eukprot:15181271-Heterocapsa_arctica.AAC.1
MRAAPTQEARSTRAPEATAKATSTTRSTARSSSRTSTSSTSCVGVATSGASTGERRRTDTAASAERCSRGAEEARRARAPGL